NPNLVQSDGEDLWVTDATDNTVSQVHASTGKLVGTWVGATAANHPLVALGRVFVTGYLAPQGRLYMLHPQGLPAAQPVASNLGAQTDGIAFDGQRIWTANQGSGPATGSISIITPTQNLSFTTQTITTGFNSPIGVLYDGQDIWVTDRSANTLLRL